MTKLPVPRDSLDDLCADLDVHGYCLARQWLDPDALAAAKTSVYRQSQAGKAPCDRLADIQDWVIHGGDEWILLQAGESGLDHLITHPCALGLSRHLLGQRVHLSGFSSHVIHPGNEVMELHTDQWWLPRPVMAGQNSLRPGDITRALPAYGKPEPANGPINPAVVINVMWAVTDFSGASGSTRLVPGSHLSGVEPDPSRDWETVDTQVPAGGAVIWDARTWHASGRNTGNGPRIGITATYCAHQYRQIQNHTAAVTPETYATLDDEMRELLGFRLFSSYGATDSYETEFARPGFERA